MPHPTPTAATSASPPPRGGRGTAPTLGVGGRPSFGKPRPGLEPGPRPATRATRKVPGQARDGVAFTLAAALLTSPTQAQIIPTGTPAADILLSQAITEQRVFLTCSSLDGLSHPLVVQSWQREVTAAVQTLTANKVAPEAIGAFAEAAKVENLLPAEDTTFFEVRQFCAAYPDWQTDYARLDFTILELKLHRVFE